MQALCALLLFAGAASTIAFTPHANARNRRGAGGAGAGAGAGASATSFATSGAYGSGHGGGGAGGAGGFAFPGPASYGPASFEAAFRSYFDQMEAMLAAQQAHAQALSNRFWAEWQNSIPHQAEAAQQSTNSVSGGYSPQYFQYGTPQASHSHTAVNFYPHRFNPANANSIGNNVDAGQVSYGSFGVPAGSTNYASVSSDNGGGVGYGGSYGGGFGGSLAGAGGAGQPTPGSIHAASPGQSGYSAGGGGGGLGGNGHVGSGLGGNAQGAQASLSVSNRGGFGEAQLFPDPDLSSRIAGDIPPLSGGGSYGVFSSSSSSSHSDPSGKTHTFKEATVGVNDNGKVTTFSVKDP